ncbi:hypothetical protein ACEL29_002209, partial [Neisseria gonorrhoeae]
RFAPRPLLQKGKGRNLPRRTRSAFSVSVVIFLYIKAAGPLFQEIICANYPVSAGCPRRRHIGRIYLKNTCPAVSDGINPTRSAKIPCR